MVSLVLGLDNVSGHLSSPLFYEVRMKIQLINQAWFYWFLSMTINWNKLAFCMKTGRSPNLMWIVWFGQSYIKDPNALDAWKMAKNISRLGSGKCQSLVQVRTLIVCAENAHCSFLSLDVYGLKTTESIFMQIS